MLTSTSEPCGCAGGVDFERAAGEIFARRSGLRRRFQGIHDSRVARRTSMRLWDAVGRLDPAIHMTSQFTIPVNMDEGFGAGGQVGHGLLRNMGKATRKRRAGKI